MKDVGRTGQKEAKKNRGKDTNNRKETARVARLPLPDVSQAPQRAGLKWLLPSRVGHDVVSAFCSFPILCMFARGPFAPPIKFTKRHTT